MPAPFALRAGNGLTGSIVAAAMGLFSVGAILSLFTGRSAWWSGARLLALGACAGGLTYLIGRLFGVVSG